MENTFETPIVFGFMAENKRTGSRFYAAIPATKITVESEIGKRSSFRFMSKEQAVEYVLSGEFLMRKDNRFWKDAVEHWGPDNFRFHYYPDDYTSETEFFERYANPIIDRMHWNTELQCYNTEFSDFDDYTDWGKIREEGRISAEKAKAELERKKSHKRGRAYSSITIKVIETGEEKSFESKGELMEFLGCGYNVFSKFLEGKSRLNKTYEVL